MDEMGFPPKKSPAGGRPDGSILADKGPACSIRLPSLVWEIPADLGVEAGGGGRWRGEAFHGGFVRVCSPRQLFSPEDLISAVLHQLQFWVLFRPHLEEETLRRGWEKMASPSFLAIPFLDPSVLHMLFLFFNLLFSLCPFSAFPPKAP